jgi:hypothetical protein
MQDMEGDSPTPQRTPKQLSPRTKRFYLIVLPIVLLVLGAFFAVLFFAGVVNNPMLLVLFAINSVVGCVYLVRWITEPNQPTTG